MRKINASDQPYLIRPCTIVYIVLISLTLITWLIGKTGVAGLEIALLVLVFALVKGLLIGDYYMGLGSIRGLWRWPIVVWLFVPGLLIGWAFYIAA